MVVVTDRHDGDLRIDGPAADLAASRSAIIDRPWTWMRQVHGAEIVEVQAPGDGAGAQADAAVTTQHDAPIAVQTADCAPIALIADEAVIGVVHAGWRGLMAGVVEAAAAAMARLGAKGIDAVLGPCIHPHCYAFGADDLERVVDAFGSTVVGRHADGGPALDLPATVAVALDRAGIRRVDDVGVCTGCAPDRYSHRTRGDVGRQATVVWIEP